MNEKVKTYEFQYWITFHQIEHLTGFSFEYSEEFKRWKCIDKTTNEFILVDGKCSEQDKYDNNLSLNTLLDIGEGEEVVKKIIMNVPTVIYNEKYYWYIDRDVDKSYSKYAIKTMKDLGIYKKLYKCNFLEKIKKLWK